MQRSAACVCQSKNAPNLPYIGSRDILINFSFGFNRKFPGEKQYERYRKLLGNLLSKNELIMNLLKENGLTPNDIGWHSFRKGASTNASGGSTRY